MANSGFTVDGSNLHPCGLYPLFFLPIYIYIFFFLDKKPENFGEFFSFIVEL